MACRQPTSSYATFDHPLLKLVGLDALLQLWREFEPVREGPEYLFLDEIQVAKDWQVWIKHEVDFEKRRRVAVTGSATPLVAAVKTRAAIEEDAGKCQWLEGQAKWMGETIVEIIISEGQNEVADFKKWGFDIIPHRARMKQGFEVGEKRVDVETAFKNPEHPFRVAIVCAMWLTGFDVEWLSTLSPFRAATAMERFRCESTARVHQCQQRGRWEM